MSAYRLLGLTLAAGLVLALAADRSPGQGTTAPKAKAKPKSLTLEPSELPKPGAPLSGWALVQRPAPLKNIRSWSVETKKHRYSLTSMTARPDGKKVATGGHDGMIRIWDPATGEFERMLVGHDGAVGGMAWSPDGKYLAAAGYYATHIWDDKTGLPVRVLRGKYGAALVAWSPDGTKLLTGGGGSGQIALWDVLAGKQLAETEYGNPVGSIAYSPTGEQVAVAASRAGTYIVETNKLKTVHVFKDKLDTDYAVGFSPDGKKLAAGSDKQTVIYDADSGSVVRKLATPGYALTWTPQGDLLIANTSYQITPYAADTLAAGKPLPGNASILSLTDEGKTLFGLYGNQVAMWDLDKGTSVRTWTVGEYQTLICGPTPSLLVPGAEHTLWDMTTGKKVGALEDHKGGMVAYAWGPTGKTLAVAAADNKVRVYEPATAKLLRTLASPAAVSAVAVSADGRVACSTADKKVTLWAAMGDKPAQTLEPGGVVPTLAWSRDGRFLATARDKEIGVWSSETGKSVKTLEHPRPVYSLAWSTDGGRLVVGSSEEVTLAHYLASTWKLQPSLDKGTAALAAVAWVWSPNGATLLGYRGGAIQQWDGKTGRLGTAIGSIGSAGSVAFWPDGRTVDCGCVDRAARYFDASTGRLRFTAVLEKGEVLAVAAEGHYRCPEAIEAELVAVVMSEKEQATVPLKELAAKYGFKNVSGNVK